MKRKPLSRLARTRIFDAAKERCCICGARVTIGSKWTVEHIKPLWLGGADNETNMAPAHYDCAIEKTRKEAPVKAKNDRQRANHLGIRRPSSFACSRSSPWKKKISGEVVRR